MKARVITLFSTMLVAIVLSGCMGDRVSYSQRNFILQANRDLPHIQKSKDIVLSVQDFNGDDLYTNKNFVYRIGQSEYETDFYNQFLLRPEDMITSKTRRWLSDSGLFKLVLEPGSYSDATEMLEGNLLALYVDFRDKQTPKAVLKVRFFVLDLSDKSVLYSNTYEVTSTAKDNSVESLVGAFNESLVKVLSELEKDLQKNL